jgi:hypothetical protein
VLDRAPSFHKVTNALALFKSPDEEGTGTLARGYPIQAVGGQLQNDGTSNCLKARELRICRGSPLTAVGDTAKDEAEKPSDYGPYDASSKAATQKGSKVIIFDGIRHEACSTDR